MTESLHNSATPGWSPSIFDQCSTTPTRIARVTRGLFIATAVIAASSATVYAHPAPTDVAGVTRSQLGIAISLLAFAVAGVTYLWTGLRRSSRATTVNEFFFFDKRVSQSQYFDVTIGYSFQVVVTLYFIYWGFRYGIGILYYALTWLVGIWLFQLAAPKLLPFALSYETLHSFLATRFGASLSVRRLTAFLTLFGLIGALLIEVSYTTDLLAALSTTKVGNGTWIPIFCFLLGFCWLYVQYGGYKATVLTDTVQLVMSYLGLSIVFAYLIWLGFRAGYFDHTVIIASLISALWLVVAAARTHARIKGSPVDVVTRIAFVACIGTVAAAVISGRYWGHRHIAEAITDLPDSFRLAAFAAQDKLVLIGFTVLNLAWQFFDMTAWQRISSLEMVEADRGGQLARLRKTIGETKWESPVTWAFGIVFGVALRHTGMFKSASEALDSFWIFVRTLVDNDIAGGTGMVASYVVLPALVVAMSGIMLTTVASFLATVTFTWIHDITLSDTRDVLAVRVGDSDVLKKAKTWSLLLLATSAAIFIVANKAFNANIFLLLNTIYSAQFAITFFTLGALFLASPATFRRPAIASVLSALVANVIAAGYCYQKMLALPGSAWEDWFYILPTIASAAVGGLVFLVPVVLGTPKAGAEVSPTA